MNVGEWIFCARVSDGLVRMTSYSALPSMYSNTMPTSSKQRKNVVIFPASELYHIGFLYDTLEAELRATDARFAVGFGGAE